MTSTDNPEIAKSRRIWRKPRLAAAASLDATHAGATSGVIEGGGVYAPIS